MISWVDLRPNIGITQISFMEVVETVFWKDFPKKIPDSFLPGINGLG